jgi:hypothetical protein
MNIMRKILFLVLIICLVSCKRQKNLIDTWISAPVDTVFTSWDISDDLIISNTLSPDKSIAKYKIQGNKIVIDSGAVLLGDFYISENESLQFRLSRDKLKIELSTIDSLYHFDFECKPDLLIYDKLLPSKLLDIDLPYADFTTAIDDTYFGFIFIGFPKIRLLNEFKNDTYLQLNDVLTNSGNPIVSEFVSFDSKNPMVIFCDKKVEMIELDSLRMNLYHHKILFAVLNEDLEFGYLETNPFYYCNCTPISNMPPPRPLHEKCKHTLYQDLKWKENHFRIDSSGNYYLQNTMINIIDIPEFIDLNAQRLDSNTYVFIQYDDFTKFDSYFKLYASLIHSFDSINKHQDRSMTIIDINEKDLNFINHN